jgi:hypothetical protein
MIKSTPWGPSHSARHIGEGIFSHSTSSHGGLFVPPEKLAEMPAALRCNCYAGGGSWFEEDCEWSLVCLAFPHLFRPYDVWLAGRSIRHSFPELGPNPYAEAVLWLNLEAGEQVAALIEDFEQGHGEDWHLGSMSTSGRGWDCMASTIGGSARIRFNIAEYPKIKAPFTLADLTAAGAENIRAA